MKRELFHFAVRLAFGGTRSLCGVNYEDIAEPGQPPVRLYGSARRTTNPGFVSCKQCLEMGASQHGEFPALDPLELRSSKDGKQIPR